MSNDLLTVVSKRDKIIPLDLYNLTRALDGRYRGRRIIMMIFVLRYEVIKDRFGNTSVRSAVVIAKSSREAIKVMNKIRHIKKGAYKIESYEWLNKTTPLLIASDEFTSPIDFNEFNKEYAIEKKRRKAIAISKKKEDSDRCLDDENPGFYNPYG